MSRFRTEKGNRVPSVSALSAIAPRDALAARLAVEIGGDGADRGDLGMVVEPAHRITCGR
jgi:hypothetical protein